MLKCCVWFVLSVYSVIVCTRQSDVLCTYAHYKCERMYRAAAATQKKARTIDETNWRKKNCLKRDWQTSRGEEWKEVNKKKTKCKEREQEQEPNTTRLKANAMRELTKKGITHKILWILYFSRRSFLLLVYQLTSWMRWQTVRSFCMGCVCVSVCSFQPLSLSFLKRVYFASYWLYRELIAFAVDRDTIGLLLLLSPRHRCSTTFFILFFISLLYTVHNALLYCFCVAVSY